MGLGDDLDSPGRQPGEGTGLPEPLPGEALDAAGPPAPGGPEPRASLVGECVEGQDGQADVPASPLAQFVEGNLARLLERVPALDQQMGQSLRRRAQPRRPVSSHLPDHRSPAGGGRPDLPRGRGYHQQERLGLLEQEGGQGEDVRRPLRHRIPLAGRHQGFDDRADRAHTLGHGLDLPALLGVVVHSLFLIGAVPRRSDRGRG